MSFLDNVGHAKALLAEHGRVSLRGLRRQFGLDDETLEDFVEELVDVQRVAHRDGGVLVWDGERSASTPPVDDPDPAPAVDDPDPAPAEAEEHSPGAEFLRGLAQETAPPAAPIGAPASTAGSQGERRQLTVLFCDMVGSTRLSATLDPEDWREVVRLYRQAAARIVESFAGHVAQYLGDGILAYFGHPTAHEDDAERALRAGIGIVRQMDELNDSLPRSAGGMRLQVRIGVHTGPVVVGTVPGDTGEVQALGETTNLASRIQHAAQPDTVVMSTQTQRLVQGIFSIRDRGEHDLVGVDEPVRVIEVERVSGVRSRFDGHARQELAPLVGREQELGLFDDRFQQVADGIGQVLVVSGEAGIGKSRLVQAFRERLGERPHSWLESWSSPYTQDSAFYPTQDLLRQALGLRGALDPAAQVSLLETALRNADLPLDPNLALLTELLGLPLPADCVELALAPEGRRLKLLALLTDWVMRLSRTQPLVLLVEDCHWSDPSSLELVTMLIDQVPRSQVMIVVTHRPGFETPWGARSHVTPMLMSRMTRAQLSDLVRKTAGERVLPDSWLEEIVRRSDGVPLFAEELTKTVIESNPEASSSEESASLHIPETLQDSLMARLDALGPVKELAQLGAVLGREFDYELLLQLSPQTEESLLAGLRIATQEELFYQRGTPPAATFRFKHTLIRDAAYQSLLRSQRRRYHLRVAETLLDRSPRIVDHQPERVAYHLAQADEPLRALPLFERAGALAAEKSAHAEAESHFRRALALLSDLPTRDLDLELSLQIALARSALQVHGFGSDVMAKIIARERELIDRSERGELQLRAMQQMAAFYSSRGEMLVAVDLSRRVCEGGRRLGDDGLVAAGITTGVLGLGMAGRLREALALASELPPFEREAEADHAIRFGVSSAFAGVYRSLFSWCIGLPDQADALMDGAVERARLVGLPHMLAAVLVTGGAFCGQMRRLERGLELAEEGQAIAEENGFALFVGIGRQAVARSRTLLGDPHMDEFLDAMRTAAATGNRQGAPITLCGAALMQRLAGEPAAALGAIDLALNTISPQGQPLWDSELMRLRGEIEAEELQDPASAEVSFGRARAHARGLDALSLELRAVTSHARLLSQLGRGREARALLSPVYGAFEEGHGHPDLADANELLEALPA